VEQVLSYDHVYRRANELVTFIDNHDMPRFLSIVADARKLPLALVLLMTLRGVPCLFYGTEQGLHDDTNGGEDPYNRPMMERWDQGGELYRLLAQLAALRRRNRALTMGSHQQRYVSNDLYAYSRHYRDSAVLMAVNQGPATALTLPHCGLPDGTYRCLLSERPIQVEHGAIQHLWLDSQAALVLEHTGAPVTGDLVGVFQLNGYHCQPGERLAITGSCAELGHWDGALSYGMEYVNSNTWIAEVPLDHSAGSSIHYKFMVCRDGTDQPMMENILGRQATLPRQGRLKFDCIWNDD